MKIKEWFTDEVKFRIVRIAVSGIALTFSLFEWETLPLGIDMAWIAIILCGIPIIIGAATALYRNHDIKADLMVSLALIGSLIAKQYFAAGEVAFIMEIGSALEDFSAAKARKGIEKLINLLPKMARVRRNGREEVIPSEDVRLGDTVIVTAGETIPVDGIITKGNTSIDQSVMTGESIPVDKTVGDSVISGTVNSMGVFEFRATNEEKDSSLQMMFTLAKEAEEKKAPIVNQADRWATWLVLFAMTAAVITFIVNYFFYDDFSIGFNRAVTVLVVVCPCAFVLATPTAIVAGIGNATKYGLLVRSGEALQRFAKVDTVAFDKTGTLTYGKPRVSASVGINGEDNDMNLLRIVAAAEQHSEHPLGKAIVESYKENGGGSLPEIKNEEIVAGNGVKAEIDGSKVIAGKLKFLNIQGISVPKGIADKHVADGASITYVAADGKYIGYIALEDTIREDAPATMRSLKKLNVDSILLTGDHSSAARKLAETVGLSSYRAELLPADKQRIISEMHNEGHTVCMTGDGINDSLALASADAAIAMGGIGSDIAIESSDVVLVNDDIRRIPYIIELSRKVLRKINFNIIVALCINAVAVGLSATGILNAVVGALVHNCGSVFVVVNSLFLLRNKPQA